jgi:hypothetical protein
MIGRYRTLIFLFFALLVRNLGADQTEGIRPIDRRMDNRGLFGSNVREAHLKGKLCRQQRQAQEDRRRHKKDRSSAR